jgi:small GTP-binding protein
VIALSKKICLLGDFAVGKTSLVRRFIYNLFEDKYLSTIGVKVSRKVVAVPRRDEVVELTLMLWDLAGSEEFDSVRTSYLRGASGGLAVCDLTRPATLDSLRRYAQELRAVNPQACLFVAGNKADLTGQWQSTEAQVQAMASEMQASYFLTSAKTGEHVEEAFRQLGRMLVAEPAP